MALSYRTRRTIVNATVRSFRDPRQLIGLLVVVGYVAINLGVVVALLALPLPQLLIQYRQCDRPRRRAAPSCRACVAR